MTTTVGDVRVALNATPLLAAFNGAALLAPADVHVAQRLGRLTGEADERVLLAVALAVRAVRAGSVCLTLEDRAAMAVPESEDAVPVDGLPWPSLGDWQQALAASPLVAVGLDGPADRPVRWIDGRLYLDRYWRHEQVVRAEVDNRLTSRLAPVDPVQLAAVVRRLFPTPQDARQRLAAAAAVLGRLTVLTGGPGTGKTTTVARVLAVLQVAAGPDLRVALAAPTGKAAARLQEAVRNEVGRLGEDDQRRIGTVSATTVHRLLGWKPGTSTRFRHDRGHHLPHEVVVVDETSMVSLPLMSRLVDALRPDARLLLLGDPDQLASVEAGAVLGDLVARLPVADALPGALAAVLPGDLPEDQAGLAALRNGVVRLELVHRHGAVIGSLARAIREEDADAVVDLLRSPDPGVSFVEPSGERPSDTEIGGVRADVEAAGSALVDAARAGEAGRALRALETHRLLLAHRRGPFGVAWWAAQAEEWVATSVARAVGGDAPSGDGPWYVGRPLLVTRNDRDTGLYNGDAGVVVADGAGGLVAAFGDPTKPVLVRPHRLPAVETVHAMTVHRAQGSQFAQVSLLLPPPTSPLLTRELLYTAVTRAQEQVRVIGSEAAVRAAVARPVRRASGLRHQR